ncbi:MAG: NHL repeat-containing protein [Clostridia bacterium]|nr:NHL repeat-containing protein [Clostridia bacterium]
MKNMKKIVISLIAVTLILSCSISVFASVPYHSYNYSFEGTKSDSLAGYIPDKVVTGHDIGVSHFDNPRDIFVDTNKNIYIADTDNKRIIITDSNFNLIKILDTFTFNGAPYDMHMPMGVFVTAGGEMYIANRDVIEPETGSARPSGGEVVVCDLDGNVNRIYTKPETPYLDEKRTFQPTKVVVDSQGVIYALSDNINEGIVSMDQTGKFLGFFGSEKVSMTAAQLAEYYWRKWFLNDEQLSKLVSFQPTEYSNMYIDAKDFIYTSNAYEELSNNQIKRLNPNGANVLEEKKYGDLKETINADDEVVNQSFVDITADTDGFIFCLDKNVGRIYVYNQDSQLVMIFGDMGTKIGTFKNPVAIENINGNILVLDNEKENITVFKSSAYGDSLRNGIVKYQKGLYQEALEPWQQVRDMNANFEDAYTGIGKAEMLLASTTKDNEESKRLYNSSMKNFKLANDRTNYSVSKKEMRTITLRDYFTLIVVAIIALFILLKVYGVYKAKINNAFVGFFTKIFAKFKKEGK